jgi:predicted nucleic acid-binding protein
VDTSIWVDLLRDSTGQRRTALETFVDPADVVLTRFTQLELLQGCRDDREWGLLSSYLEDQEYAPIGRDTWGSAARIFFEMRRAGRTVASPIDCCIAELALEHRLLLLHRDRDFETIARARPALRQRFLDWEPRASQPEP